MPVGGIHRYSAVFTAHTAQLKFGGSYTTVNFNLTNDGHGGTLIKDPPAASPANVALFGNYIAAGFPVPAATPARPCSPVTKRLLSRWRSQGTGAEARWFVVDSEAPLRGAQRATKQSIIFHQYGLLRGAGHRAGHFGPDPLARNDVRVVRAACWQRSATSPGEPVPHAHARALRRVPARA
jgi:hypothetical protein